MKLANEAWFRVSNTTVANCWRKSGIISPRNPDGSIKSKDNQPEIFGVSESYSMIEDEIRDILSNDLDCLESLKIVHKPNRMTISELLNPIGEHSSGVEEWTPEEIYESIQEELKEKERAQNMPPPPPPPRPTHQEFLKASDVMMRYWAHDDDDDVVRGYERVIKASVRRCRLVRVKSAKQQTLTDFVCKSS